MVNRDFFFLKELIRVFFLFFSFSVVEWLMVHVVVLMLLV